MNWTLKDIIQTAWPIAVTIYLVWYHMVRKGARAEGDDAARDRRIARLEEQVSEHVETCNETPNALLLSEIKAVGKTLSDHAETDKTVSTEIRNDIRALLGLRRP